MRSKFIIILALLTAGTVHAQLTFLSDNRSVSAFGSMTGPDGTQSYSQTNIPSASFANFNGFASGSVNNYLTSSSANQTSFEMANQISCSTYVVCQAPFGANYNGSGSAHADGTSFFNVSFSVSTPTTFSITENDFNDQGFFGGTFTLSSANNGVIVSGPPVYNYGFGAVNQYSGLLEPNDTYTLQISTSIEVSQSTYQDVAQNTAGINVVMAVPEPSSSLLLEAGAVILGLVTILKRRRTAIAQRSSVL